MIITRAVLAHNETIELTNSLTKVLHTHGGKLMGTQQLPKA